jgi:iron complex outermembrane receptor protein
VIPPAAAAPEDTYGARARADRIGASETPRYGTASRQGVPLEELPASVSVIESQTLRVRGVNNLDEALSLTPGVTPTWQYGGFLHIRMRGNQAVTLFDGYRDSRSVFADSAPQQGLFDVDRIEVLRGPASVLYGYGAVGGVVNLVRKQASRRNAYELDFGMGLPDQLLMHAGSQGGIGEHLSYRFDIGRMERTDYRGASTERNQVSGVLRYTPANKHTFDLRFSYALDHYNTDVGIPTLEHPRRRGRWGLPPDTRLGNRYSTANDHLNYKRFDVSLDYRYDITESTYLRAHAGVMHDDYQYLAAESLTYVAASDMMQASVEREYLPFARTWRPIVGQLELHSDQNTGLVKHQLVFGYEINHFGGNTRNADTGDAVPGTVDFAFPADQAAPVVFQTTSINYYRHLTHSVYSFDHIKLLENVIVTGGLRFDTVRSRVARDFVDRYSGDVIDEPEVGGRRPVLRTHREALTGQAGVVFTPWQPVTAYVGYSSSFKPVFIRPGEREVKDWEPERGQQVEGGLRGRIEAGEHRVEFDAAVYWLEKSNVVVPLGADDFTQAGKQRSQGLDFAVSYHAPILIDLSAGYSLTDATFRNFVNADPITGESKDLRGKHVAFAPRHSATAWLGIRLTEQIGIGVGGRIMAKQYADPENRVPMPDYALLDASAWWKTDRAMINFSVRNVLDERGYYSSAINQWAPNPQVTPGPGREVLCTLKLQL